VLDVALHLELAIGISCSRWVWASQSAMSAFEARLPPCSSPRATEAGAAAAAGGVAGDTYDAVDPLGVRTRSPGGMRLRAR
jgi:hypothetical protein